MKISLKVDYLGEPYIMLLSEKSPNVIEESAEDQLLEFFIREAKERGIQLKNDTDMQSRDDCASVHLCVGVRK